MANSISVAVGESDTIASGTSAAGSVDGVLVDAHSARPVIAPANIVDRMDLLHVTGGQAGSSAVRPANRPCLEGLGCARRARRPDSPVPRHAGADGTTVAGQCRDLTGLRWFPRWSARYTTGRHFLAPGSAVTRWPRWSTDADVP